MNKKRNYLAGLASESLILNALDRFAIWVYSCLASGMFGRIFTSCNPELIASPGSEGSPGFIESFVSSDFMKNKVCGKFRKFISSGVESSLAVNSVLRLTSYLRGCYLKFYGFLLLSFGMYSGIVYFAETYILNRPTTIISLMISLGVVLLSLPLILSKHTLASAVLNGKISHFIFVTAMGFREDSIRYDKKPHGKLNAAFIAGLVLGLSAFFVPSYYVILGFAGLAGLYLILVSPEIGILIIFAALPFVPTMILAGAVGYISVAYFLKLMRGKRILRLEPVDIAAFIFMIMLLLGGFFSVSRATSIKPVLVFVCFMLGYFLTVNLIRTREWAFRCFAAIAAAATGEAAVGIFQYFKGDLETKWIDTNMFENISGRITATLENPNLLAEYIILTLPVLAALLFSAKGFRQKFFAFIICGISGACLILTWSRGAWIGLMAGAVLFIMIYHRRSIYLLLAGAASLPLLPFILPEAIVQRFTSIGNMGDSSTSYRVYIWRATVNMIGDYFAGGIGVGEGAFRFIYPRYSYAGVEAAPHSHNLYLQIWIEIGIFGLLVFAAFVFLLIQNNFSYCRQLQRAEVRTGGISKSTDRVLACACMCGLVSVLVQGMTDYIWYSYRIFLMFWMIAGLSGAFIRIRRNEIKVFTTEYKSTPDSIDTQIKI